MVRKRRLTIVRFLKHLKELQMSQEEYHQENKQTEGWGWQQYEPEVIREPPSTHSINDQDYSKFLVEPRSDTSDEETSPVADVQDNVINYGQQLRHERELRAWTLEQLAGKIDVPVSKAQSWENDSVSLDLASRQKLSQILGNDFYLSSEVMTNGTLQVRIVQRLLTAQDFTTIISVLTEFHTQFW